jgi:hypothetical protein
MGATNRFSEATDFPGRFRKAICSSHAALEQPLILQQKGLGKSVKISSILQEVK